MIGQVFTPISVMKKVFRQGERSLAREEVYQRLQNLSDRQDPDVILLAALSEPRTPFQEGSSRAIIEFRHKTESRATKAVQVMSKSCKAMTESQLLRRLRAEKAVTWSFPFVQLGLVSDRRFVQASDGRWLLNEWDIVNDLVYDYLSEQKQTQIPMNKISSLLKVGLGLKSKNNIFIPECDTRFKIDQTRLQIRSEEPINTNHTEVAAAMSQDVLVKESTVVDEVVEGLLGALTKLETRTLEMNEEVVTYFSSNDLEAIKILMNEKEKSEQVLSKLKEMVEELT